jgi:hypothetical protein
MLTLASGTEVMEPFEAAVAKESISNLLLMSVDVLENALFSNKIKKYLLPAPMD